MNRLFVLTLFCAISLRAPVPATATPITIDTVPVGNPGNALDVNYGIGQRGAVAYNYRIGTYEVTNDQYFEFLKAKAGSDPLGLYVAGMGSDPHGGITRSGIDGSYGYAVKADMGSKPVNFVSWYSAIRFANWLHNGQGLADTEDGAYTLLGGSSTPSNFASITRNAGATWFLPNENEWYKAAYYDPRTAAQGGPPGDDNYWLYPTSSDSVPTIATAIDLVGPTRGDIGNPGANIANYNLGADWNSQDGNVTTIGSAGPLSASFYGTFDQGGNVWEMFEEQIGSVFTRGLRGGSWNFGANVLRASDRSTIGASGGANFTGFRLAAIPEPNTLLLGALGAVGLLVWRRLGR